MDEELVEALETEFNRVLYEIGHRFCMLEKALEEIKTIIKDTSNGRD